MSKQLPFGNKAPKHAVESRGDFNSFGLEDLAYVKAVQIDGQNCSLAFATVRQYEMEPLSVH
jgi:hypothetical protein